VEYKFNVASLDTKGDSGDAVGLLLGSCRDELGASTDEVGMLEVGQAGVADAEEGSGSPCVYSSSAQKRT